VEPLAPKVYTASMRQRRLGKTEFQSSELALGTWGLSGDGYLSVPESEQDRVIDRALALGIRLFDTSDSYGDGAMERRLGQRVPDTEQHLIVTKLGTLRSTTPPRKCFEPGYLREAFERSRERLRRKVLGAVLLHNPSRETIERGEATGVLQELKSAHKLRFWGVSVSTADAARSALARGAELIALPYNAFYSKELREVQEEMAEKDRGLLVHSVLAYGLLCGKWSLDKEFPYEDHRSERWTIDEFRKRIRQLDALRPAVGGDVLTMRAAAVRYVLSNARVGCAILGPRNSIQLDQLVREAGREPPYLTEEKRFALEARLREVGVNP
jgi:aryl-alcohol dehydrogenase-like predicted oxidoreductase